MAEEFHPPTGTRFPRNRRILAKKDFERVFREGRKTVRPSLVVYSLQHDDGSPSRIGFAISRKVGGAAVRNRWRRRLREAFRLSQPHHIAGCDIVVVARPVVAEKPPADVLADLLSALRRSGVLASD